MRDGLSLLDQVLSFGEGASRPSGCATCWAWSPTTCTASCCGSWPERRADGGVPVRGAAGRGGRRPRRVRRRPRRSAGAPVLAVALGGRPTVPARRWRRRHRASRRRVRARRPLRILRGLADVEEPIRRSGNPRLVVETLLVRWARDGPDGEIADIAEWAGCGKLRDAELRAVRDRGRRWTGCPARPRGRLHCTLCTLRVRGSGGGAGGTGREAPGAARLRRPAGRSRSRRCAPSGPACSPPRAPRSR